MKQYGLIGQTLAHSFSQQYFQKKFEAENVNASFTNIELPQIIDVAEFLKTAQGEGYCVTIPYKSSIITFLNELDKTAQAIQAVNVIKKISDKWLGTNTDIIGFQKSIMPLLKSHHTHALVLGTGGASKAVTYVLKQLNIPYVLVSRSMQPGSISYIDIDETILNKYQLIINCTPLGTFPNIESCPPLPYHLMNHQHLCFDLVYNPSETKMMKMAQQQGATVSNGYEMLVLQAEAAWQFWND